MDKMSDGKLLGIVVAVVAVIGDFFIYGIGPPVLVARLLIPMCIAWLTSGLGLLTVWLGIGGGRLYLRLLVIGVIGAITVLLVGKGTWSVEAFAGFVLFLAAGALPFGLLYIVGLELMSAEAARHSGGARAELRGGQFSLRQLFGWTVAATLVASVARFAKIEPRDGLVFGVMAGTFSLIAVGAVCAALLPGRNQTVAIRIAILSASAIMLTIGVTVLFSGAPPRDEEISYLALTSLVHVWFMSFVLLLYRRLGYRLRRRGLPGEMATADKPSAS